MPGFWLGPLLAILFAVQLGWLSTLAFGTTDMLRIPGILLAIALVAVLGPSLVNVVIALCVIGWVGYPRLVRGVALRMTRHRFRCFESALRSNNAMPDFGHRLEV